MHNKSDNIYICKTLPGCHRNVSCIINQTTSTFVKLYLVCWRPHYYRWESLYSQAQSWHSFLTVVGCLVCLCAGEPVQGAKLSNIIAIWVSEWLLINANSTIFQWDDNEVRFVLDQHTELDLYSASSLKQQSVDRHACHPTLTHYPDSEPTSLCSFSLMPVFSGESTNTNFIVFGLTRLELEPTIYRTRAR
jgi:hypothetical protein